MIAGRGTDLPVRARVLLLLVALVATPDLASAQEPRPLPPPDQGTPEVPLPFGVGEEAQTEPAKPPPAERCAATAECAARLGRGNVCEAGRCTPYYDTRDLFGVIGLKSSPPKAPEPWKPLIAGIPVVGSSPSTGFSFGLAGTLGILLGDPGDTTISSAQGSLWYTTKNQLIVQIAATAMLPGNEWELLSDWRYLVFSQDTYGLGTGTTPISTGVTLDGLGTLARVEGQQPMKFNMLRIHQSVVRHVSGGLYLGGGYRLDGFGNIRDERLDLAAAQPVVTSHYAYSTIYGFGTRQYVASGWSVDALWDSRDSTIAPYRGTYAHLRFIDYPTWLGSSKDATMVSAEARRYIGLSDDPRNLLALWAYGSGVTTGHVPYLALPSSGWDARGSTARGYVQGRFRGTAMVDVEAEWRFRLSSNGLFGGAIFGSVLTLSRPAVDLPQYGYSDRGENLFDSFRAAGGAGLRIMLLKQSRTALRIDIAGGQKSLGFYLGSGEAF